MVIYATDRWASNAELIESVASLGYLEGTVLDTTYGEGTFWKNWRPVDLLGVDIDPTKSWWFPNDSGPGMMNIGSGTHPPPDQFADMHPGGPVDFTDLPFADQSFDSVVFDPPYKLNGTPSPAEERYGTHVPTNWRDRMDLIVDGVHECARVARHHLLVKCQDQVCSGQVRWQTDMVTEAAVEEGFRKVDRFDMIGGDRPQPERTVVCPECKGKPDVICPTCLDHGRVPGTQKHARRNTSTLLVFRRVKS